MGSPAEAYEAFMVPALFAPWAAALVRDADPRPGERVLDLACGTGVVARQVAARLAGQGTVTGVDRSPDMLAIAAAAAAREDVAIEWRSGRAEQLPFADGSFDLVLCQFALMFFDDHRAALRELYRVLARGGRFFLSVWQGLDRHPFYRTLHGVIERRVGMSALATIFALGDRGALRRLLNEVGFDHVEVGSKSMTARFPNPGGFLAGEIEIDTAAIPSMQNLDAAQRRAIVAAIGDEMQAPLREVTRDDHVVLTFRAHIAHGARVTAAG